jgi:cyclophilin family peptidyl-prolyl cis-trans isomerase
MAKHKAPTEVTVAPLFEKSTLEKAFDKYKGPAAAVIVVAVGWVLFKHFTAQKNRERLDQSWQAVIERTEPDMLTRLPTAPPAQLAGLAEDLRDQESGPWVRLLEVQARITERDYEGALATIQTLRAEHPDHPLVSTAYQVGDEVYTVTDRLQRVAEERQAWEAQHSGLFENPPPPEGSPRVRLTTSAGEIEIALYAERAPEHVENFLKHCREGFYDGTKFHRVVQGFMIQGGDPNSREEDPTSWGQGGTDYTLEPEDSGLYHFAGVLSAAKKPTETEESGSQFFLTTDAAHHLDGQHTVYGQVVGGMEIVRTIAQAPVSPEGSRDRPLEPVTVEATEVVE